MYYNWVLLILLTLVSYAVSAVLQNKFKKYSKVPLSNGMTGRDVAEKMLRDNGIYNVKVISTKGMLTDHYNPTNQTVNLSEDVFATNSVAAAAVAAHECGHAVQFANKYEPLVMRSSLVPIVNFASKWVIWVLFAGILLVNIFPTLLWVGVALFAMTTIFAFVTLPVEINASRRALAWLNSANITNVSNHDMAKDALKWAAYTYVVEALGSLANLVYYIIIALNANNRRQ